MLSPNRVLVWVLVVGAAVGSEEMMTGSDEKDDVQAEGTEEVAIIKQINRVNDDGTYTYGYEAADGSFKIETRDVLGNVKGMFGFIDETGELKRVSYTASNGTGFQANGEVESGARERRPILVLRHPTPVPPPATSTRAGVIQHIPRRGERARAEPTEASPRQAQPLRVLVTKRPLREEGRALNLIRRQLAADKQEAHSAPRRFYIDPRDVYRNQENVFLSRNMLLEENDLKPDVPRYYISEDPEVPAVVPMVERVLRSRLPPRGYAPVAPIPYRPHRLPQRVYDDYDQPLDLEALREEIMNYLIQYIQYRARRINPYYSPYLEPQQPYYPQQVLARPVLPPPPPPPPPAGIPIPVYYPRHLPITPSPNIQYSHESAAGGGTRGGGATVAASEARPSPLVRMLLASPHRRAQPLRSVEIISTAASTTPATPLAQTKSPKSEEMEAAS